MIDRGSGHSLRLREYLHVLEEAILQRLLAPLSCISVAISTKIGKLDMCIWTTLMFLIWTALVGSSLRCRERHRLLVLGTQLFLQVQESLYSEEKAAKTRLSRTFMLLIQSRWLGIKVLEALVHLLQDSTILPTSWVAQRCTYLVVGTAKTTSTTYIS